MNRAAFYVPSVPWAEPDLSGLVPIKITPDVARFIELQTFAMEEVARWFCLTTEQLTCNMT